MSKHGTMIALLIGAAVGCKSTEKPRPSREECKEAIDKMGDLTLANDTPEQAAAVRAVWAKDDSTRALDDCTKHWTKAETECIRGAKTWEASRACFKK